MCNFKSTRGGRQNTRLHFENNNWSSCHSNQNINKDRAIDINVQSLKSLELNWEQLGILTKVLRIWNGQCDGHRTIEHCHTFGF